MARKRMIDPEFWSDEEIGQWSHSARLFYIALWNFADDEGRFKAHDNLLKSQIFPYDNKVNIQNLKKEMNGKIQWYEIEGLQYGFIRNFNKHQKIDHPSKSKLPDPPPFGEDSVRIRGTIPPNLIEVKLREVKRSASHKTDEEFFEELKKTYDYVDLQTELKKIDGWLLAHPGRQKTRRFIINWLNKIDRPLRSSSQPKKLTEKSTLMKQMDEWEKEQKEQEALCQKRSA